MKKKNDQKIEKIKEKEEKLKTERIMKSLENKKKIEKKDEDIIKMLKEKEEEINNLSKQLKEAYELRIDKEKNRRQFDEINYIEKQNQKHKKLEEMKKNKDEGLISSQSSKIFEEKDQDKQKSDINKDNILKASLEERRNICKYISQERENFMKLKLIENEKKWEEKTFKYKEVKKMIKIYKKIIYKYIYIYVLNSLYYIIL
jgi:hypothetical protein